jgi:hypothetical protein
MVKIKAHRQIWTQSVELLVCEQNFDGKFSAVADPILMRRLDVEDGRFSKPIEATVSLHDDAAQQLMDELWNCGLRPSEGTGSAGSLRATERHLEDMRRLVFEKKP